MKPRLPLILIFMVFALAQTRASAASSPAFVLGADVSWVTQMEASGVKFYDATGAQQDCFALMKSLGLNAIRLRVWVNPAGGWCGQDDVVAKARRAAALGMRVMIDFHYSDYWADPGKQNVPAAWVGADINQLATDVANHTTAVLSALKTAGVTPEWVQIGNETNSGMLWPLGSTSSGFANFALLVNAGNDAAKAVFPSVKTIVHISNGYDDSLFRWMFDGLTAAGARFDVIGMSLYPDVTDWPEKDSECLDTMNDMVSRYGKQVMVCEVGMDASSSAPSRAFLADIIAKTKSVSGGAGLGVFYWEPECYGGWQGYGKGAFDSTGKPTIALDSFKVAASAGARSTFTSISSRSYVGTGDNIEVAGFVISGSSPITVLIRASGPALTPYGVTGVLSDPMLELYDQVGPTLIASDDNWGDNPSMAAAIATVGKRVGAFAWTAGSKDAALLVTLNPGIYTAQVKGVNGATGVTLMEVYDAD